MSSGSEALFPGKQFISTVLELVDSKAAMSARVAQRYLMRAAMAGIIVGVFYVTYYAIVAGFDAVAVGSGNLHVVGKFLGSLVFGWALVFIYYSKSELLTSNMMISTIGVYYRKIRLGTAVKLLTLCLIGNAFGGLVIAVIVAFSTLLNHDVTHAMQEAVDAKLAYYDLGFTGLTDLFLRALLCNFMINLAMLLVYNGNIKSDVLNATVMVMSVFVFDFEALEHSVANTVLFLVHGLSNGIEVVPALVIVAVALLGNFVGGGILIGLYYAYLNDEARYLRRHRQEVPAE